VQAQDRLQRLGRKLLAQGLDQFKAMDFKEAKARCSRLIHALKDADKKNLEDALAKIDPAIKQQTAAREAYADADKALKAGDLAKAKDASPRPPTASSSRPLNARTRRRNWRW